MTPVESAIHNFVQDHAEAQTRFLAEIVKIPSDNPPGDCAARRAVATLLEGLASRSSGIWSGEPGESNGMISATNLIVKRVSARRPTIALNAHGDVVPPGSGWTRDPYGAEIVDGWMFGRGVAVSKSDIATYAFAMLALEQCGAALNGAVELHLTYDEEAGGEIGPRWLVGRPHASGSAIAAGFSYAVVNAHNGCLHLEVEVLGRSAHAARPSTGVDALEAANPILGALYGWRGGLAARISAMPASARRRSPSASSGRHQHQCRARPRHLPSRPPHGAGGEPAEVEAELRAVIARAAGRHPAPRWRSSASCSPSR